MFSQSMDISCAKEILALAIHSPLQTAVRPVEEKFEDKTHIVVTLPNLVSRPLTVVPK